MGKVKKREISLRYSFVIYLIICVAITFTGVWGIGIATNILQDCYLDKYEDELYRKVSSADMDNYIVQLEYRVFGTYPDIGYRLISGAQYLLIPGWVVLCMTSAGVLFYRYEMKEPIEVLKTAAGKIGESDLDFTVKCNKNNELGKLCESFEEMRLQLYQNNMKTWRAEEERRRVSAAFAHDLRTPLTVLRGYSEMLKKYIPEERLSGEELCEIAGMMEGQITRLEQYTRDMSELQKLEDIRPRICEQPIENFVRELTENGRLICGDKDFALKAESEEDKVCCDRDLFFRVYENLLSNASRYARGVVRGELICTREGIRLTVSDDGQGFSRETLASATKPFYRDEKQDNVHLGLGLYVCQVICEKCGGSLEVTNGEIGGMVTAFFTAVDKN